MELTKEQNLAASSLTGSSLVIAVPGAGKTSILLKRIENLIDKGVSPEKILTITFSKAAATELKSRFLRKNKGLEKAPEFFTIHAFSFRVVRDYTKKKGKRVRLLEGAKDINKYSLIRKLYGETIGGYISDERLENLVSDIGYIKNMMITRENADIHEKEVLDIINAYDLWKKRRNFIDFDDMLSLALRILKTDKSIRKKYTNMYDYIQVDEGQDTSKLQMEIIKLLTKERDNLFIVADDDQSIYSFRGADPQGLFSLSKDFDDLKIFYMETNFRCSKNIILAANSFIDQNEVRYSKNLKAYKDYCSPIDIVKVKTLKDQYEYIFDEIDKEKLEDYAILYRNNVSAMPLVAYMERENIPFQIEDSSRISFVHNRVTKDLLDILDFSKDRTDKRIFERIFYKMRGYTTRTSVEALKYSGYTGDVLKFLINSDIPSYKKRELEKLSFALDRLEKITREEKIGFIEKEIGYKKYLDYSAKVEGTSVTGDSLIFYTIKDIFSDSKNRKDFLGRLKVLDNLLYKGRNNKEGIHLSTVHSAKGKEYENLFIIDVYKDMFPGNISSDRKKEYEEERRLFYVAMTRAKEKLSILFPETIDGEKIEVSEFLIELSEVLN